MEGAGAVEVEITGAAEGAGAVEVEGVGADMLADEDEE
jgi:hypothetical protein